MILGNNVPRIHDLYYNQVSNIAQDIKKAGGVLFLSANFADGYTRGVNTPTPTNPFIDRTGYGNNATLNNFSWTGQDGYTLEATVNSNGQSVGYSNLVVNGDFANTSTWVATAMSFSVLNNEASLLATAQFATLQPPAEITTAGARYYARGEIKANSNLVSLRIYDGTAYQTKLHSGSGNYELLSVIATIPSNTSAFRKSVILDSRTSGWSTINAKNMQTIRLDTNPFVQALETQLGRQLTVSECDRIFPFVATTGVTYVSARPYLATDGIDSYGVLANNPSVDIVGTEDFVIAWNGITPSVLQTGFITCKNNDTTVYQYGLILSNTGALGLRVNALTPIIATGILPNTNYDVRVERKSNQLKCWVNGVLTYDQPFTESLVTQPYLRMFARSNNVSGTANTSYFKGLTAYLILARGTYGDLGTLDGVIDNIASDYRIV